MCLHNVSDEPQPFQINLEALGVPHTGALRDLLGEGRYPVEGNGQLILSVSPYEVVWLKA